MSEEYTEIICTFHPFFNLKLFENKKVNIKKKYSYRLCEKKEENRTRVKQIEKKKQNTKTGLDVSINIIHIKEINKLALLFAVFMTHI